MDKMFQTKEKIIYENGTATKYFIQNILHLLKSVSSQSRCVPFEQSEQWTPSETPHPGTFRSSPSGWSWSHSASCSLPPAGPPWHSDSLS